MPAAQASFGWQDGLIAYSIVLTAAFLVSWLLTGVMHLRRPAYIAALTAVVVVLGAWYLAWSGTTLEDSIGSDAARGLAAGLLVAAIVTPLIRRFPKGDPPTGPRRAAAFAWDDIVYGFSEALLLATYPVITVWHAMSDLGWTQTGWRKIGAGALAVLASLLVILVHHLGYEEFRTRAARTKLVGALLTCGLQAIAFLTTASVIAPIVAHIALHVEITMRGISLPPVYAIGDASDRRIQEGGVEDGDHLADGVRERRTLARQG